MHVIQVDPVYAQSGQRSFTALLDGLGAGVETHAFRSPGDPDLGRDLDDIAAVA